MVQSKAKGSRGEREIVELFREYGFVAERTPMSGAWILKGDVQTDVPHLHVEVKRAESMRIHDWIGQACEQAKGKRWLLCMRRNRSPWYGVMDLHDLLALMARLRQYEDPACDNTGAVNKPGKEARCVQW